MRAVREQVAVAAAPGVGLREGVIAPEPVFSCWTQLKKSSPRWSSALWRPPKPRNASLRDGRRTLSAIALMPSGARAAGRVTAIA